MHKFNLRQGPATSPTSITLSISWPAGRAGGPLIVDLDENDAGQVRDAADLAAGFALGFCGGLVDPVRYDEVTPYNLGIRNGRRSRRDSEAR